MTKATFEGVNYEVREGTGGNDRLIEGLGRDWIKGGAGNDTILDRLGDNLFDGGAGSDSITGGIGKDRFIHRLTENVGSADRYEGGLNTDTLRLELTAAEWGRADVQADIAGFLAHVATTKNKLLGLVGLTSDYKFTSTNLTVSNIEKLEIRVNGVAFDPTDQKVTAVGETFTISSAAAASINLLANDTVPDRVATISFATLPGSSYGSIAFAPSLGGNAQTANLTFTPGAGYTALKADEVKTETFTYTIKDVDGDTATATATIKIVGVNDGPVAVADSATTNEDTTVTIDVLANDTDPDGDSLTIVSATGPNGKGTVSVVDNKLVFDPGQAFQALGTGQSEAVELSYIVKDMQGVQSTATAMMTVTGIDDGPVYDEQFIGTIGNDIFYQFTPFLPSSSVRFSGNSFISTFSGDDSVYGDGITTSLDVDPLTSSITSGNDYIDSGEGDDVAIGDYVIVGNTIGYMNPPGQIPPDFNIQNYFTGNDILNGGDGNDQLMGDVDIASLYPRAVPNGSSTNVNFGDDSISGGVGNDEIIGDSRFLTLLPMVLLKSWDLSLEQQVQNLETIA